MVYGLLQCLCAIHSRGGRISYTEMKNAGLLTGWEILIFQKALKDFAFFISKLHFPIYFIHKCDIWLMPLFFFFKSKVKARSVMHKGAVLEGLYLSTISCKTTVRVESSLHLLQPLVAPCRVTVGLHTWCPKSLTPLQQSPIFLSKAWTSQTGSQTWGWVAWAPRMQLPSLWSEKADIKMYHQLFRGMEYFWYEHNTLQRWRHLSWIQFITWLSSLPALLSVSFPGL